MSPSVLTGSQPGSGGRVSRLVDLAYPGEQNLLPLEIRGYDQLDTVVERLTRR